MAVFDKTKISAKSDLAQNKHQMLIACTLKELRVLLVCLILTLEKKKKKKEKLCALLLLGRECVP